MPPLLNAAPIQLNTSKEIYVTHKETYTHHKETYTSSFEYSPYSFNAISQNLILYSIEAIGCSYNAIEVCSGFD